ncbi:addiction module protein [Flavobacterium restrictum]|uniref:Addiction module protein n=1 Tax=Flavobacterium restrictum TaxID=2594428 RepID=A0A553E4R6_9FLAO|nr:addiction module protein [Flavobacterium restrictum]TRX40028.1 addiction module protein [Flavobacterium restrictum]
MNAIRQFIDVKNNSFNVLLPDDFKANRVEVIVIPSELDDVPQWQKIEALRRLEIYKNNPDSALDFDQVMDKIDQGL